MVFEIRYREDLLPFRDWFVDILVKHCGSDSMLSLCNAKPRIQSHVYTLDRREIDVYIACRGKRICIELKETDFEKAVHQAIGYLESGACDLAYIAVNDHVYGVLEYARLKPELIKKVFEHGIGVIAAYDNVIVFRAFERKNASRKYTNLLELVKT